MLAILAHVLCTHPSTLMLVVAAVKLGLFTAEVLLEMTGACIHTDPARS